MKHPIVLGLMIALALIPQTSHALPQKPAEPKTEAKPAARNATATTNVADETATSADGALEGRSRDTHHVHLQRHR